MFYYKTFLEKVPGKGKPSVTGRIPSFARRGQGRFLMIFHRYPSNLPLQRGGFVDEHAP
jgi:hypothetical protein